MPHELQINADVTVEGVQQALKIIQGYCHMIPQEQWKRKIDYRGPLPPSEGGPPLKGFSKEMAVARSSPGSTPVIDKRKENTWLALGERLMKQSYYIQLFYREDPRPDASP